MIATVSKWGNSLAVRIPSGLVKEAGLKRGAPVEIYFVDGEIRIRRRDRKRYNLDEMLASVPDDFEPEEWNIGPPVGNEIW
ncbi:MAG: AbrB/MazE/SpoVT family DNA-binding domain-containing protein [Chloroflexi bacterium]|nr:AbrB/MazE/SpoVT family DNA-binding domain-containing protein [Chloroflexota bacterium]MCY3581927.1 AbrB/MazE/SpoVT family DNA-binding domain-containing protein [Chloroflexota bacterium]MCY3716434.1 AbrB/MazE/SpoVT family DNA-binding domain-containing protein [Chloroflexota bacterium]MDE2650936.1 AbrB/MazE/SpoVT family DNA-binding domain-containing protein [Chloroflexota bacterium]MXX84315.1 AbrB/MazE/SpoVT family DNA-binding domain-containing protein [Chloroflexota bacterium]